MLHIVPRNESVFSYILFYLYFFWSVFVIVTVVRFTVDAFMTFEFIAMIKKPKIQYLWAKKVTAMYRRPFELHKYTVW